ncbi:MAG: tetratricopeptide repeat protein [Candidatus Omnitrophica bacterium]|nr:tetratricopeptide repeat protein [Candidatus Omnitrophota bacterium]
MNKIRVLSVILLVLFSLSRLAAQEITTNLKEEETLFMAKKAFEDGFYEVSLGLLERFLHDYPGSSKAKEAELLVGECYFHQNKFMEALAKFEALLKDPQAESIKDALYYWMAEVNFKGDNFTQATAYYKNIIREFPKSSYAPLAYYSVGWSLFQERKFRDALGYFKALVEKFPQEPQAKDAAFKIIECLYNLKDYATLKRRIGPTLKLFSKDSLRSSYLYFYLGEADYYLGNFSEAINAYSKALANSPDEKMQALIRLDLAWAYLKLKHYKEAEDIFWLIREESLEKRSRDILWLGKAVLFMDTNRVNEAKKLYEQILSVSGDPLILAQAYIGRADAFYNLADYAQASRAYQEALSRVDLQGLSGQTIDKLYYNLSWSWLKQGDLKQAIKEFQKVAATTNDTALKISSLCQVGDIYQDSGDYKKAQNSYQAVLKAYPDASYSDYAQYQLGAVYLKDSRYEEAISALAGLEKKFPASKLLDNAAYTLGLAYFKQEDYHSCKDTLRKFQNEFKESDLRPKALYLLGDCFYNLEDYAAARQAFKEVIKASGQDMELAQKAEYGIADCFYQSGEEEEALKRFKALRSKYPDANFTPEIIWWLGRYYYQHNEPALAARYFLSLVQDFPKSDLLADAYYALGLILAEGAQTQEALDELKKALDSNRPDIKSKAAVAMAGVFFKTGDYDNSLDYYRKGLQGAAAQELAGIHLKIAEILESKAKLDEAIKEYLEVVRLADQGDDLAVSALLRLGQIYEDRGDRVAALDTYNRILKMNVQESKYAEERLSRLRQGGK